MIYYDENGAMISSLKELIGNLEMLIGADDKYERGVLKGEHLLSGDDLDNWNSLKAELEKLPEIINGYFASNAYGTDDIYWKEASEVENKWTDHFYTVVLGWEFDLDICTIKNFGTIIRLSATDNVVTNYYKWFC